MIISVNWLKKFTTIDVSIDELTRLIGARLVEIEEVIDLGKKYEGVVIAKVVECQAIEGSDHLNVCKIDDGGTTQDIERDESGLVQVVCGAPNVRTGLMVAWLPPNSTVPETYGKEPFVLGSRNLRGVMSNGMLASAKELDLFDDHTGILELEDSRAAGERFADAYELNDYLLVIENKSLTHRPDTFGIIGFAREVAAIQGKQFITPKSLRGGEIEWVPRDEYAPQATPTPYVIIDNAELSRRYQAVVLDNVDAKAQSPLETQTYLARVGVRPHSAVVDVTNYLMMLTGQPLHAFDYEKLKAVNDGNVDIHVRSGRENETLVLIDGREITLSENDIVVANGETAVALAGAMGGRDTEIDENTTKVLLESATFNLYNLRNTQMRHGIFSEAITRFTKGQPAELTAPVLVEAVKLLGISAGATRVSDVADAYPAKQEASKVYAAADHMNAALGTDFSTDDIVRTLTNVEFAVSVNDKGVIAATAPYWRSDIHISEDLDEEVGRLNGFDAITPLLPKRDFRAVGPDNFDTVRAKIRRTLVRAGANEVLSYSFVHGDLLRRANQDPDDSYKIVNSISPDLQYYRQSVLPSILSLVHPNIKAGYDSFALFELNKAHAKSNGLDAAGLPHERDFLAFVVAYKKQGAGATYYEAKRYVDYLAQSLGVQLTFEPAFDDPSSANAKPFEIRRSAAIQAGDTVLGIVGEFKKSVIKSFKLSEHTAGFVIDSAELARLAADASPSYRPLSRYPGVERDVCYQVALETHYAAVFAAASEVTVDDVRIAISPLDIYHVEGTTTKNITLTFSLSPQAKTLASDEANSIIDRISQNVIAVTSARIV